MTLALDGSVHGTSTASSLAVSLTTTNSNDIICVVVTTNGAPVTSITATGLSFTNRTVAPPTLGSQTIEFWKAVASSPLSTTSITVNTTTSAFLTIDAFGISGANTSTIFDSNASLPATSGGTSVSISTSNANDILLDFARLGGASTGTTDSGFTVISNADFQITAYQVVSATQSSLSLSGSSTSSPNGVIADAIIQSAAGPPIYPRFINHSSLPVLVAAILENNPEITRRFGMPRRGKR